MSHRLSFKSSFNICIFLLYVHIYYKFKTNMFKPTEQGINVSHATEQSRMFRQQINHTYAF